MHQCRRESASAISGWVHISFCRSIRPRSVERLVSSIQLAAEQTTLQLTVQKGKDIKNGTLFPYFFFFFIFFRKLSPMTDGRLSSIFLSLCVVKSCFRSDMEATIVSLSLIHDRPLSSQSRVRCCCCCCFGSCFQGRSPRDQHARHWPK